MKHLEEQLAAYLDGELEPGEMAGAKAHLSACESCRDLLESHRMVSREFKALRPEVPSQRMWRAIQARLASEKPAKEPGLTVWEWLESWGLTLPRLGLAMAACLGLVLVAMVGIRAPHSKDQASRESAAFARSAAQDRGQEGRKILRAPAARASKQEVSKASAEAEPRLESRADSDSDAYADDTKALSGAPIPKHTMRPMVAAQEAGLGSVPYVAASQEPELAPAPMRAEAAPPVLPKASGGPGPDGLWNWSYFNRAVAGRQWLDAAAELKAARKQGAAGTERSFAATMINLLSLPSQPLSSVGLAPESESWSSPDVKLVLMQANTWKTIGDHQEVRLGGEVMTRLKGFRTVGPGFLYDFSANQGVFERGTRFTRLANESAARVKDADGKDYLGNEFTIVENAVYDFKKDVILLKADQSPQP